MEAHPPYSGLSPSCLHRLIYSAASSLPNACYKCLNQNHHQQKENVMDNNKCASRGTCSTEKKECSIKHFLLPAFAVFIVISVFEWLFHGVIMMPSYKATAEIWRPMDQMQHLCFISLIKNALIALASTCLFKY